MPKRKKNPLHLVEQWWLLAQSLPPAIQVVTPNKARSVKNAATQQWTRLKLRFGMGSLTVQEVLQDTIGKALNQRSKARKEAGEEPELNLFVNRTPKEMERKRARKGDGLGAPHKGKGGKGKGRGKGRGAK